MEEKSRNRRSDKSVVTRLWHESSPWVHIITLAVLATVAWQSTTGAVASHEAKLKAHDAHLSKLDEVIAAQSTVAARIEQKVDYVREDVKAMRRDR